MTELEQVPFQDRNPLGRRAWTTLGVFVVLGALIVPPITPVEAEATAAALILERGVAWARKKDVDRITTEGILPGPVDPLAHGVGTGTTFRSGGVTTRFIASWDPGECRPGQGGRVHCRFKSASTFGTISFRPLRNSTDVAYKLTLKRRDILERPVEGPLEQEIAIGADQFLGSIASCVAHRKKLVCR